MFNIDPSGKFKLVAKGYLAPPASCLTCGNGNCEEGYIDCGAYVDYYGQVYLCWFCAIQLAETFGCVIPEDVAKMEATLTEALNSRTALESELETANERLAAYSLLYGGLPVPSGTSDSPVSDADEDEPDTPLDFEGSDDGESVTPEPVTDVFHFGSQRNERSDSPRAFGF